MNLYFETSHEPAWGAPKVEIEVAIGEQLRHPVIWSFLYVSSGPTPCVFDGESATVGSDSPFHQSLRFGADDLNLQTCQFSVPDRALDPALADEWVRAPEQRGLPRLLLRQNFSIDRVDGQIFSADGLRLIGLLDNDSNGRKKLRLHLGDDLWLLFSDDRYVGWMLHDPIAHVVSPNTGNPLPSTRPEVDAELILLFRQYFQLIDDPVVELMENKDPAIHKSLVSLIQHVQKDSVRNYPRLALHRQLTMIQKSFYG